MSSSQDELSACSDVDVMSPLATRETVTTAVVPSDVMIRSWSKDRPSMVWGAEGQSRKALTWSEAVSRMQTLPHLQYVSPGTGAELTCA